MKTLFAALSVIILAVAPVLAQPPHHKKSAPPPVHKTTGPVHRPAHVKPIAPVHTTRFTGKHYHHRHGHQFRYGFYYRGFNHNHWTRHYWDARYGTFLYYDPYALAWYYWCAPHYTFYPVAYVPLGVYAFPYVANPQPPAILPEPPPPLPPGPVPQP